jgi:glutamate racemase
VRAGPCSACGENLSRNNRRGADDYRTCANSCSFSASVRFMGSSESPIAILDSGLGGLTVVRAIHALLPREKIVYFGDTARLPYGSKTAATVTRFVRQIIAYLRPHEPKHVVIACNTATALALPAIKKDFADLSISGVIEPGAKAAVRAAGAKHFPCIGIIATEATIRSKAYDRAILRRRNHARLLLRPTPLLVPMIEEGRNAEEPLVLLALREYLAPLSKHGIDVMVMGCTHYPILRRPIQVLLGPDVAVIDSAEQCAQDVARLLKTAGRLLKDDEQNGDLQGHSREWLKCFVTDDSPRFAKLGERFLGTVIDAPTCVCPDELYNSAVPQPDETAR